LWVARVGGLALVALNFRQGMYEVNRLLVQKWAYAERIFSVAFLAMLLGALVGWKSDRAGAAFLMSGYLLAIGFSAVGRFSRPELAGGTGELALVLLPFLVVGLLYAYAGRRSSLA
jgi:nitrate/nitrite transporter NarK